MVSSMMLDEKREEEQRQFTVHKRKSGPTFSKIKPKRRPRVGGALALRVIHPPESEGKPVSYKAFPQRVTECQEKK